jgi:hypothetical protein
MRAYTSLTTLLLVGLPRNDDRVLRINPADNSLDCKTLAEMGVPGAWQGVNNKFAGGVLAPNGMVVAVPYSANSVLTINSVTETADTITLPSVTANGWKGGVLTPDGRIFCTPYSAQAVLIIDLASSTQTVDVTSISNLPAGTGKWSGAALAHNGKIYAVPFHAESVLVIDPSSDTSQVWEESLGATLSKWDGAVMGPNGKIYGIPGAATQVLAIDPIQSSTEMLGSLAGPAKWMGGALARDGKIYGAPSSSVAILSIAAPSAEFSFSGCERACYEFTTVPSVQNHSCTSCTGEHPHECSAAICSPGFSVYSNGSCCVDFASVPSVDACVACSGDQPSNCTSARCAVGYSLFDEHHSVCCNDFSTVPSVMDNSCRACSGDQPADCSIALCEQGFTNYADGFCCDDFVNVPSVEDNSCSMCVGPNATDCRTAVCADGYHSYGNGTCCLDTLEVRVGSGCACAEGYSQAGRCAPDVTCPAGTQMQQQDEEVLSVEDVVCVPCSDHEYSHAGGVCSECEIGKVPNSVQSACELCIPGKEAPTGGLVTCTQCEEGMFRSQGTQCMACQPGSVPDTTQAFCEPCPAGKEAATLQDGFPTNCTACAPGTAASAGQPCRTCQDGKYSTADGSTCEFCPAGMVTTANRTKCACESGSYSTFELPAVMCFEHNYVEWPDPTVNHHTGCLQCNELTRSGCLTCEEGIFLKRGYALLVQDADVRLTLHAFKCPVGSACPGHKLHVAASADNISRVTAPPCPNGTTGRLCSGCDKGWKRGPLGRCRRCGAVNGGLLNPLFLIPLLLAAAFVALRHFLTFKRQKRVKALGRARELFQDLDANNDGKITREELCQALVVLPKLRASDDTAARLVEEMDIDHSGTIDEHELYAWMEQNFSALQITMAVGKIVVGLGQVLAKQPEVLKSEKLGRQFEDMAWLQIFAFNFAWVVPVCEIDYATSFLANTVLLPACLFFLVAITWRCDAPKEVPKEEEARSDEDQAEDHAGFDEKKINR